MVNFWAPVKLCHECDVIRWRPLADIQLGGERGLFLLGVWYTPKGI